MEVELGDRPPTPRKWSATRLGVRLAMEDRKESEYCL